MRFKKKKRACQPVGFDCKLPRKCGMMSSPSIRLKEGVPIPNPKRNEFDFPKHPDQVLQSQTLWCFCFSLFRCRRKDLAQVLAISIGKAVERRRKCHTVEVICTEYIQSCCFLFLLHSRSGSRALGFLLGRLAFTALAAPGLRVSL